MPGPRSASQLGRRNRVAEIETCCWPGCRRDRHPAPDAPPLCGDHLVECATFIASSMSDLLDPRRSERAPLAAALVADPDQVSVVYYVRIGEVIKIGTTTNLAARLRSLSIDHDPSLLLATEQGGITLERHRHAEFAADRVSPDRELFRPSVRIIDHIRGLRIGGGR